MLFSEDLLAGLHRCNFNGDRLVAYRTHGRIFERDRQEAYRTYGRIFERDRLEAYRTCAHKKTMGRIPSFSFIIHNLQLNSLMSDWLEAATAHSLFLDGFVS